MSQSLYTRALGLVVFALLVPVPPVGGQTTDTHASVLLPQWDGSVLSVSAPRTALLMPIDLRQGRLVARYNILKLVDERYLRGAKVERFFEMAQSPPATGGAAPPALRARAS
jgi:hypothetical protein